MNEHDGFLQKVKAALDHGAHTLDPATAARLRQARVAALAGEPRRPSRSLRFAPLALAASVLIAVGVWLAMPQPAAPAPELGDLALLSAPEEPEFYDDLEFYHWLEEQDA